MKHDVHFKSDRQDWGTPRSFIDWIQNHHKVTFDLDAAASDHNHKAPNYITKEMDSLSMNWSGHVWLNPPFGRALPDFMRKCAQQIANKNVDSIRVLIPARTDTKWFHEIVMPHADKIYLIKGRFNFRFDEAIEGANAPFPSMLVVYDKSRHFWESDQPKAKILTLDVPKNARGFQ